MSMHLLHVRCQDCKSVFMVRKPNSNVLISMVVPLLKCPICSPNQNGMCGGCRLPLAIVGRHMSTLNICGACFQKEWRWNKQDRRYKKRA